jgi:hypothetical protein
MPEKKKFVPFAGDPKRDRPNKKQTRDEINAIRKSGIPDVPVEKHRLSNWVNTPKVAKRTSKSV